MSEELTKVVQDIHKAAHEKQLLFFSYRKRNGQFKKYKVEPYSFRGEGDKRILMAWDIDAQKIKKFYICEKEGMDGIVYTEVLPHKFEPRNDWKIEISNQ